jgi:hypothetical protein
MVIVCQEVQPKSSATKIESSTEQGHITEEVGR